MAALAAERAAGKSTPQRKLDEALAVDAALNDADGDDSGGGGGAREGKSRPESSNSKGK